MSSPPASGSSANLPLYIMLGLAGGLVLLCGGMAVFMIVCMAAIQTLGSNANSTFATVGMSIGAAIDEQQDDDDAETATAVFVQDLVEKRYQQAFQRCAPAFRAKTSPEALEKRFDSNPVLRKRNELDHTESTRHRGSERNQSKGIHRTTRIVVVEFLDGANAEASMEVELERMRPGQWEITDCTVR